MEMLYSNKGFQDLSQIFYSDKFIVTLWTDYCTSLSFCEITLTFSLYRHSIIKRIYNFYLLNPSSICSISSNGWHSLPKKKYSVISWWIQVLWMTLNFHYRHGGWEKTNQQSISSCRKAHSSANCKWTVCSL